MTNRDVKTARRVACYPTFAADQALAAVRTRLPEVSSVRSKLTRAAQADALGEALADLTPYEMTAVLAAMTFAGFAAKLAFIHETYYGCDMEDDEHDTVALP